VLHKESTAVKAIEESKSGIALPFHGSKGLCQIEENFLNKFEAFRNLMSNYDLVNADPAVFEAYSAKATTAKLAALLDQVMEQTNRQG